jgi:hypothetical protein
MAGSGAFSPLKAQKLYEAANERHGRCKVSDQVAAKLSFSGVISFFFLVSRRLVEFGCGAALRAASEVERSGTERLSGFRRA